MVIKESDIVEQKQLMDPNLLILVVHIDSCPINCNEITIGNESYYIMTTTNYNSQKIIIARKFSNHSNSDNPEKSVEYDENAVLCPSCGHFLDDYYDEKVSKCPKCSQKLIW